METIVRSKCNYRMTACVNEVTKRLHTYKVSGPNAPLRTYEDIIEAEKVFTYLTKDCEKK